jgi:hypothetical protein
MCGQLVGFIDGREAMRVSTSRNGRGSAAVSPRLTRPKKVQLLRPTASPRSERSAGVVIDLQIAVHAIAL